MNPADRQDKPALRWKYFIPHTWDEPRTSWEDVYLLPEDVPYDGDAIWLTVHALDEDTPAELCEKLGEANFVIEGDNMFIRPTDFSMDELLRWAEIYLEQTSGRRVSRLREAPASEFAGRSVHAGIVTGFIDAYESRIESARTPTRAWFRRLQGWLLPRGRDPR